MSGAEEVCMGLEQEREPEATYPEAPAEHSKAKPKRCRFSRSSRAGLIFSVSRVDRQLRNGHFAKHIGDKAPVYLAAVLQSIMHKVVKVAGSVTKKSKRKRISPAHLQTAVQKTSTLKKLLQGSIFRYCGNAVPQSQLVSSLSTKKKSKSAKRCPRSRAAPAHTTAAAK